MDESKRRIGLVIQSLHSQVVQESVLNNIRKLQKINTLVNYSNSGNK